ncbi:hypothetical protein PP175_25465 (plasmid) [Aneurinibacillus sp. Ricciae_BoGa-3]|uniref:hypothetical protein n=1 Tax=Aneurinibacillus sp. Ricciae_BoGa-3 TaxID=3022697 RepID=UPI0023416036|nr:hypothetical protein [Aneurinibacillus sp. Ricciae_BoGa-3]WCK57419.1 hypothetical protein PP175_25465 [Aneurinibacillus sp. Ricciae_BoGa-3]
MKTYYHVSRDIENIIDTFEPKVPESYLIHGHGNSDIKRVCISEDIMDCMNAISYIRDRDVYNEKISLYKPLRVYRFELDEEEIVQPEEVYNYGVYDALNNKECWSLKEIKPVESYIITPTYIATERLNPNRIALLEFEDGHFPDGIPDEDE